MKLSRFKVLIQSLAGITLLALPMRATFAQGDSVASALGKMSTAFSGGKVIQSVQLSGNATWDVGSRGDSGTVTLLIRPILYATLF